MVDFLLTVETSVSYWALTEVASLRVVNTTSTIKTGSICTGVSTQLAVVAIEARWTGALVSTVVIL